jgi:hypothetical protein
VWRQGRLTRQTTRCMGGLQTTYCMGRYILHPLIIIISVTALRLTVSPCCWPGYYGLVGSSLMSVGSRRLEGRRWPGDCKMRHTTHHTDWTASQQPSYCVNTVHEPKLPH